TRSELEQLGPRLARLLTYDHDRINARFDLVQRANAAAHADALVAEQLRQHPEPVAAPFRTKRERVGTRARTEAERAQQEHGKHAHHYRLHALEQFAIEVRARWRAAELYGLHGAEHVASGTVAFVAAQRSQVITVGQGRAHVQLAGHAQGVNHGRLQRCDGVFEARGQRGLL